MKNKSRCSIIRMRWCLICITCLCSCGNKEKQALNRFLYMTTPEYVSEEQFIFFKDIYKQDIKAEIMCSLEKDEVSDQIGIKLRTYFSFYNYGGAIRLFNGCGDDLFITNFAKIAYIKWLSEIDDRITIAEQHNDNKYGTWGIANISIGNSKKSITAFMTPLSMKAYKEGDDSHYIYVHFHAGDFDINKEMDVIFWGGSTECLILNNCINDIRPQNSDMHGFDGLINGPGFFWHKIDENCEYLEKKDEEDYIDRVIKESFPDLQSSL